MLDFISLQQHVIETNDVRLQLLSEINDYTIYCHFIGYDPGIGKFIRSPIRVDTHPSFNLYYPREPSWDGQILYKDFSGSAGSVFRFVKEWAIYNEGLTLKNNQEIVDYIRHKLQLGPGTIAKRVEAPPPEDNKVYFINAYDQYTKKHREYLENICVDLHLAKDVYQALPCQYLMNEYEQVIQDFGGTVTFAYVLWRRDGTAGFKLYQPYEENFLKFFLHSEADIPQGYWQCKNTEKLIITKSMKDIMVIQSNTDEWIDIVAPHGEGYAIQLHWIEWYLDYDEIIIMYDPDLAGFKGLNALRKALIAHPKYRGQKIKVRFAWHKGRIKKRGRMVVPVKDFADLALIYGRDVLRNRLKQVIYE